MKTDISCLKLLMKLKFRIILKAPGLILEKSRKPLTLLHNCLQYHAKISKKGTILKQGIFASMRFRTFQD